MSPRDWLNNRRHLIPIRFQNDIKKLWQGVQGPVLELIKAGNPISDKISELGRGGLITGAVPMALTPWQARTLAVGGGLLLATAFPPLDWWPLALAGPIPGLLAVWSEKRNRRGGLTAGGFWSGFRLGWIFGMALFVGTLWWIQYVSVPGMLLLCAYLALYPALALGLTSWLGLRRDEAMPVVCFKILTIAAGWTGLEWVRGVALSGFPWNGVAVPLFHSAMLRQLSAWAGVNGLTLLVLLPALLAAACWRLGGKSRRMPFILLVCILAGAAVLEFTAAARDHTLIQKPHPGEPDFTALLVQPNLSMEEKMSPDFAVQRQRYTDLVDETDEALAATAGDSFEARADLVVWPESALPSFFEDALAAHAFDRTLAQGNFTLVTGTDAQEWDELHNSVAALRGTAENHQLHAKIHLVPFGEFIPFRQQIPLLQTMLGGLIPLDFAPGNSFEPLRLEGQIWSIVPLVCFEDTIGEHARKFIRAEPQVLVNVTNDNWFQESPATEMHFANARWRAPELRRALLRSANTGVTASVSPEGEIRQLPSFHRGVLTTNFTARDNSLTFYAAHGDVVSQWAGLLAAAAISGAAIRRRKGLPPLPPTRIEGV